MACETMSIFDQKQLLASIHPFDLLDDAVLDRLIASMDISYYPKETVLISPSVIADVLYIIIKGNVNEYVDEELHNVYGAMDTFDANALIYGKTSNRFVVEEELICYELPKQLFMDLIQDEIAFKHFYMEDFVTKHQKLKQLRQQNELTPFMVARVEEIYLHEPCIVSMETPINSALEAMKAIKASSIIVEDNGVFGIVTDTNLRDRVLMGGVAMDSAIGDIATFPLISMEKQDFLFNALLLFTKHGIKRLAVVSDKKIIGVLEQLDLLSFFANHSHLVAMQIDKADSVNELKLILGDMVHLIRSLNSKGVKVRYISKLVNALNAKIYRKVFEMCVPEADRNGCALIVMGSEGRNEQMLRTDQDNGLIISDEADAEKYEAMMTLLNKELDNLGFPPCPGNVMVTNPYWRRSLHDYTKMIDDWLGHMNEESLLAMSIFIDAQCVAGDAELLQQAKAHLFHRFEGRDDLLAHIAKYVLNFETPLSLFSGFVVDKGHENEIDLKKGGIFAIVHGVRTLALQKNVQETNTIERIKTLNNMGVLDKSFARELIEAYDTLLSTRLRARLRHEKGFKDVNFVNPAELDKIERDLLKDSFKVVNAFKKYLTYHFHLNMVV
jgi:CBS domain-containing protein